MIQLASDPNASRTNWQPNPAEGKGNPLQAESRRHAWPFISRYADKPVTPQQPARPASEHGS